MYDVMNSGIEKVGPMHQSQERADREAAIWDQQQLQRDTYEAVLSHANGGPARVRRDRFIADAVSDLGDKAVLEIGSQAWQSVLYKNNVRPRELTCINISQTELNAGQEAAALTGVRTEFSLMDAHKLDFPDHHFDFVYGVAILHHLDFEVALREIARVTKPGGRILFVEPLRLNPVARLVRALTPKARTPDERPLGREELKTIERYFEARHLYTDLFHLPAAVLSRYLFKSPINFLTGTFDALDRMLLSVFPSLGVYYRTVTIYGYKRG